jgi:signal transduction histidine kinase
MLLERFSGKEVSTNISGNSSTDIVPDGIEIAPTADVQGQSRSGRNTSYIAILFLVVLLLAALGTVTSKYLSGMDDLRVGTSVSAVSSFLRHSERAIQTLVADYAYWDDAYQRLALSYDPDFFEINLGDGVYLKSAFNVTDSLVLSAKNIPIAHMRDSEIVENLSDIDFDFLERPDFQHLITEAREKSILASDAASGIVQFKGQPHFVAVDAVRPGSNKIDVVLPASGFEIPLIFFMRPLDEAFLDEISASFDLQNVRFETTGGELPDTAVPIGDSATNDGLYLTWDVMLPSDAALGSFIPVLLSAVLGIVVCMVLVLFRMRAKDRELQTALYKARSAERAKTIFLSSMSHELRTPLNAALGFGQVLQLTAKDALNPQQNKAVDQIVNSGKHLLALVDDILDLSNIEQQQSTLKMETVNVVPILEQSLTLFEEEARNRGIRLKLHYDTPNAPVEADPTRLKQVVVNLLSNAIKYNRDGGFVEVTIQNEANHVIRISVADSGNGIPKSKRNVVFVPFSRLGLENTDIIGTGIGLTICKNLIEMMNGSIGFDSTIGVGTVFWIELKSGSQTNTHLSSESIGDGNSTVQSVDMAKTQGAQH